MAVLVAGPFDAAEAVSEVVTWVNPTPGPTVVSADNIRVDRGATPASLVAGPLLPPTATTTTIGGLTLNAQMCVQVFWVNALGATPINPNPTCGIPASPTPGTGLTIQFLP